MLKIVRLFAIFITAAYIISSCDFINNLKGNNSDSSSSDDKPSSVSEKEKEEQNPEKKVEDLTGDSATNDLLAQFNELADKYIEAYNKYENGDLTYATDLEQLENKMEQTGETLAKLKRNMTPEQVSYYDSIQKRLIHAVLGNKSDTSTETDDTRPNNLD